MHGMETRAVMHINDVNGNSIHTVVVTLFEDHSVEILLDGQPPYDRSVDIEREYRRLRASIQQRGLTFDDDECEPPEPAEERVKRHRGRITTADPDIAKQSEEDRRDQRHLRSEANRRLNRRSNPGRR